MKYLGPKTKGADLWMLIWEEVRRLHQEGIPREVEHAKAHHSKKEMSLFGRMVTEGNERTDELAKDGAMLVEQRWHRSGQAQSNRKGRMFTRRLQYAASFHCLVEERHDSEELK